MMLELHTVREGAPVLINIERIDAIEDLGTKSVVVVSAAPYYVSESYDEIVRVLRDAFGEVY